MVSQKIADMTVEELKDLIQQVVDERLSQPPAASHGSAVLAILKTIEQRRWTPASGTPKASQMIIEERNQWRQGMS
jgi:hypothetical protein